MSGGGFAPAGNNSSRPNKERSQGRGIFPVLSKTAQVRYGAVAKNTELFRNAPALPAGAWAVLSGELSGWPAAAQAVQKAQAAQNAKASKSGLSKFQNYHSSRQLNNTSKQTLAKHTPAENINQGAPTAGFTSSAGTYFISSAKKPLRDNYSSSNPPLSYAARGKSNQRNNDLKEVFTPAGLSPMGLAPSGQAEHFYYYLAKGLDDLLADKLSANSPSKKLEKVIQNQLKKNSPKSATASPQKPAAHGDNPAGQSRSAPVARQPAGGMTSYFLRASSDPASQAFIKKALASEGADGNEEPSEPSKLRIVSLIPSVSDALVGLGLEKNIIGISDGETTSEVSERTVMGTYNKLDTERILSERPDIVFVKPGKDIAGDISILEQNELIVIPMADPKTVSGISDYIITIANATDTDPAKLIRSFNLLLEEGRLVLEKSGFQPKNPKKVFLSMFGYDNNFGSYGKEDFASDMLIQAGGRNIINERKWSMVDARKIISGNPDIIIDLSDPTYRENPEKGTDFSSVPGVAVHTANQEMVNSMSQPLRTSPLQIPLLIKILYPQAE